MTVPELLPGQSGLPVPKPTESYWLREPSEELLGHRSTRDLPAITDVVIIGSGITGAFAAHFLFEKWLAEEETAQQGAAGGDSRDVVMLEAREACSGATGRVSLAERCQYGQRSDASPCRPEGVGRLGKAS